ncbi:MAG: molybdopterin molybdotransferase MoeA [Candidatus Aminicenantes bacterium]|nr:molybdopterin molybdotransferase MoeA [Candidatus Aminicenantes bacterium]NLH76725.1 molybdopterin molybdotransferase MoeA [Acidobacteriota bacterium]
MIEYAEARSLVLAAARALPAESVPLAAALGRTLARDISAREPVPPFTKATMDGYAVRAADTRPSGSGPDGAVTLEVLEDLPAGRRSRRTVGPGQAVRIMTGAPLPAGADAVVMVEDSEKRDGRVALRRAVRPGDNIGEAGEDLAKGERALARGTVVGPAEIAVLAATGRARVPVARRPKVAVIATGDEIVEPGARKKPGQIRNANGPALAAMAAAAGAEAAYLGIARDRASSLRAKLARARGADVLVLSGGVSVGDYDLVKDELEAFGVETVFWRVRIKPGKPVFFGRRGRQLVFGLPGNPTSAMVTFLLFVGPALDGLLGRAATGPRAGRAALAADIVLKPGRLQFLRGVLEGDGPALRVSPYNDQRSGVLRSMVHGRVLIVVPADAARLEAGREVDILYMDGR